MHAMMLACFVLARAALLSPEVDSLSEALFKEAESATPRAERIRELLESGAEADRHRSEATDWLGTKWLAHYWLHSLLRVMGFLSNFY